LPLPGFPGCGGRAVVTLQPIGSYASTVTPRTDAAGTSSSPRFPRARVSLKWSGAGFRLLNTAKNNGTQRALRWSTGTVRDENEVGVPDREVVAYCGAEPLQLAAYGTTDDRGVTKSQGWHRAHLVRTSGDGGSGESYIPTFSKPALCVEDATGAGLSGRTFEKRGRAADTGKAGLAAGLWRINSGRLYDSDNARLGYRKAIRRKPVQFWNSAGPASYKVMWRRGKTRGEPVCRAVITQRKTWRARGRRELMMSPPPGHYVSQFSPAPRAPTGRCLPLSIRRPIRRH
jgi:hypothetical protein